MDFESSKKAPRAKLKLRAKSRHSTIIWTFELGTQERCTKEWREAGEPAQPVGLDEARL